MRAARVTPIYRARMSVADTPSVPLAAPADPRPPARQLPEGLLVPSRPPMPRPDGLRRGVGQAVCVAFGVAWILCPAIEPPPTGHHVPEYPLWQAPIDIAAIVSIVAAIVVLWRGGRTGALLGAIAGTLMAVETIICPLAGHTPVGWWTWAQTGLSLFVLGTSAVLMARRGPRQVS
jgi:hypothetical protein